MPTPYEVVKAHYTFPPEIEERSYQIDTINELAPLPRAGYYLGGGTGKTFISTCAALYKKLVQGAEVTVVTMPPILLVGWYRWLSKIKPAPRILLFAGSPASRKKMNLKDYDFILCSMAIFKKDYDRFVHELQNKKVSLIVDEASNIKNISTDNYKKVKEMVTVHGADFLPLTATPITTPMDGYAFIKLVAPSIYRNMKHFQNVHVKEFDFFDKPVAWQNLELLQDNMKINSVRLQRREVNKDLPAVTFEPVYYELDPAHYKLYRELVENQLLQLPDGGKIDATQENALYSKLQQIVCNWAYFSGDPSKIAAGYDLVDETLEELGDRGKLVIVAHYQMTNRYLVESLKKHGAVAIYGGVTPAQQSKNKDRFIDDPKCRVIAIQPTSGGFGLDGLQHVCSDMLFLEMPQVPRDFHQTVWRLDRDGQKNPVRVRIAVAQRTIQVKKLGDMLSKDELVGKVQPNIHDLRKALLGE